MISNRNQIDHCSPKGQVGGSKPPRVTKFIHAFNKKFLIANLAILSVICLDTQIEINWLNHNDIVKIT